MKTYKETQKKYYQKNKHKIKQNNKRKRERDELERQRQRERDELEQKLYKYGFWLLLMAGVVNFILTQILTYGTH